MAPLFLTVRETLRQWQEDKAQQLAAALAFYSLLSLGPLLLIAISIAGLVFGQEAASGQLMAEMEGLVGEAGAGAIQTIVVNSRQETRSVIAAIIGLATLLVGASGVFGQLQGALNTIWRAPPVRRERFWQLVRKRLLSFVMVLGIGFLLLVSLVVSAVLAAMGNYLASTLPAMAGMLEMVNGLVSVAIITLLFAMMFKILPDIHIRWRDVWSGALLAALLFTLGKSFIGLYLGRSAVTSTYGAAGSLVVLMLWVYYSSLILLFGAKLAFVASGQFHREARV